MIWRHYSDQRALDAQFTLDSISDLESVMSRRLILSERARATTPHCIGLPYGPRPEARLDLFLPPKAAQPAPVLMFVHGGFWRSLDAATFSFVGGAFAPAGALVAVIDYPLIPIVRMAEIVEHVREAIGWLHAHAAEYGGDPHRLHVGGHSAGGHLTALALDRSWHSTAGIGAGAIRGGIAISGVFELEPLRLSFQNETLELSSEEATLFSPQRKLPADAPPLILAVGGAETQEFLYQTIDFSVAWQNAGNSAQLHVAARRNHIDILTDSLAEPSEPLHRCVLAQMGLRGRAGEPVPVGSQRGGHSISARAAT
jgi:arylformamidase